ncbi:MAG TPA: ABC transporter permease [Vicinamibacterales bacterium]|nr:ABC transporter permease [Vicinamibacterales bacterium]
MLTFLSRLIAFRRKALAEDLATELDDHAARLVERYMREGMDRDRAQTAARERVGNVTRLREDVHEMTGLPWLEQLAHDIVHGVRQMRRAPAVAAVLIATLALGIGANSAIFSVVNAVLLRPFPAPDPDRVVVLATKYPEGASYVTSDQKFNLWRRETALLQDISGNRSSVVNLTRIDQPEQVQATWVTDNYFRLYGIPLAKGRAFAANEMLPHDRSVAVLSDGLWRRAFGADPQIIGKRIFVSDLEYEIVGVAAAGVQTLSGDPVDLWLPLAIDPASTSQVHYFTAQARLAPGVELSAVNSRLAAVAEQFRRDFPNAVAMGPQATFAAQVSRDAQVANIRPSLLVLFGAVTLVLLIACVNVVNLQVARVLARQREIAIRTALGASRNRVVRQLIAESLPLALIGGTLGLLVGNVGMRALLALSPGSLPRVGALGTGVTIDTRVVLFTVLLSLATALTAGIGPALTGTRIDMNGILKDGALGTGPRYLKIRSLLIVSELAIAVMLLTGAGVLVHSFVRLRSVDPGIATTDVVTARMSLSGPRFATTAAVDRLIRSSVSQVEAIPGVTAAAYASSVPLEGGSVFPFIVDGRRLTGPFHGFGPWTSVSPHYFDVFAIPLVRGRLFTDADGHNAPGVVIINQAMATRAWPNADPLHARISIGKGTGPEFDEPAREIVGIVANVHDRPLDRAPQPAMYVPAAQLTDGLNARIVRGSVAWVIHTAGTQVPPAALEHVLTQSAGGVPVARVRTMQDVVSRTTTRSAFNTWLLGVFAVSALLLASIGVYGLIAHVARQREPEIAIRMALGADGRAMRNLLLRSGAVLTGIGLAVGIVASWASARVMTAFLYGVSPRDPVAFVIAPAILALVTLAAIWRPASKVARVSPAELLRME